MVRSRLRRTRWSAHTVEEVLTVLDGCAEIWVGEERTTVMDGQSVIVPAGQRHGFRNKPKVIG